jgi:PAS domain S-box-containing protein
MFGGAMKNDSSREHRFRPLSAICALVAFTAGVASLGGWLSGYMLIAGLAPGLIPMAPSTAFLFIIYGSALLLRIFRPESQAAQRVEMLVVSAGTILALLLFILSALGIHPDFEHPGMSITGTVGQAPMGHISPVGAFCFVIAGISFLTSIFPSPSQRWRVTAAWGPACFLIAVNSVFLLAYLYGMPLLYGGLIVPPAALTVVAFLALGIALLVIFAPGSRSPQIMNGTEKSATRLLVFVFVILACGILVAGYFYFRHYEERYRFEAENRLSSIAELKVAELLLWRKERLGDCAVIHGNTAFSALARRFLSDPGDREARRALNSWISRIQSAYQYDRVFLLDTRNAERISFPHTHEPISPYLAKNASESLRTGQVILLDFHRHDRDDPVHLSLLVPVFDGTEGRRALGVLVFRIDPGRYLYPFISRWPTPSKSAETLLVRREGDEVVFLNVLRFSKKTPLSLRFPLMRTALPAVKAVLGGKEVMEGPDYRDVPVIAALRPVPGSPWFLVAKMDKAEIYAPLRERLWFVITFVAALLISAGTGVGLIWREQRGAFYKEKLRVEEEKLESERKYRTLFENMQEGFAYCKMEFDNGKPDDFTYLKVNHAFETLTGLKNVEGKRVTEVIPGIRESDQELLEIYGRVSLTGIPESIEIFVDALKMYFSISVYSPGKEYFVAVFDVITERKRAEEALQESEERLRLLGDNLPDSYVYQYIHEVDGTSRFLYLSAGMEKLHGVSREEVLRDAGTLHRQTDPEQISAQVAMEAASMQNMTDFDMELRMRRADGEWRWLRVRSRPRRKTDGRVIWDGVATDISERKLAEQKIEEKNAELERFIYMISHDLKSPLVTIRTFLGYLEMDLAASDATRIDKDFFFMRNAAEKMGQLIDDLLEMSRVGRVVNPPVRITFRELVKEALDLLAGTIAEKGIAMTTDAAEVQLYGDRPRLVEIWQNLVENAVKFMGDQPTPRIEIGVSRSNNEPEFFVSDNGVGIEQAYCEKVFGLFEKLDQQSDGTGLGLALVKRIVEQYGGKIWIESEGLGKGTCFRFTLPGAVALPEITS